TLRYASVAFVGTTSRRGERSLTSTGLENAEQPEPHDALGLVPPRSSEVRCPRQVDLQPGGQVALKLGSTDVVLHGQARAQNRDVVRGQIGAQVVDHLLQVVGDPAVRGGDEALAVHMNVGAVLSDRDVKARFQAGLAIADAGGNRAGKPAPDAVGLRWPGIVGHHGTLGGATERKRTDIADDRGRVDEVQEFRSLAGRELEIHAFRLGRLEYLQDIADELVEWRLEKRQKAMGRWTLAQQVEQLGLARVFRCLVGTHAKRLDHDV